MNEVSSINAVSDVRPEIDVREASSERLHVVRNHDLSVVLARGSETGNTEKAQRWRPGTVVLELGVDEGNHDEVHFETGWAGHTRLTPLAVLDEAIEALERSRAMLTRLARA